jgi:hypothetical protein
MQRLIDRQNATNALIEFAEAWQGLGSSIQEQVTDVVNGYLVMGIWDQSQYFRVLVCEQNPGAIEQAAQALRGPIKRIGLVADRKGDPRYHSGAEDILDALEEAILVYYEGIQQQTADHAAAKGR